MPGPQLLGLMRRVARITLRNNPHEYTVHEDLLCSSAMYFKNIWQPIRKKLEGECPFCHFDIVPEIEPLVFCRDSCGQNTHHHCMQEWIETGLSPGDVSCPYCRENWVFEADVEPSEYNYPTWDGAGIPPEALNIYFGWVYSCGTLRLDPNMLRDSDAFALHLLRCLFLGIWFKDVEFTTDIINAFFDVYTGGLRDPAIRFAYQECRHDMRRLLKPFVVNHTLTWASSDPRTFRSLLEEAPKDFAIDVVCGMAESGGTKMSRKEVLRRQIKAIQE